MQQGEISPKHAHFIGIAGKGMSAVAILLKEQGWVVTGSDIEFYPPASDQLKRHNIPLFTPYDARNIPDAAEIIVIGKSAKVSRDNNAEVRAAHDSGKRIVSFPEILGETLQDRESIVVAGSYGKSTTTSLLAWCLTHEGIDAGYFIGASPTGMEPAHLGTHKTFVLEGDEYPTSHDDPRPKFAHFRTHDVILTSASHDHVNIYPTQESFLLPFKKLLQDLPHDGIAVLCADEPYARSLAVEASSRVVLYSAHDQSAQWSAGNITIGRQTSFDLLNNGQVIIRLTTSLLGTHNIQNIVGVAAMLSEKKLLTPKQFADALVQFKGLAQRLDCKTKHSTVPVYEGFGSSREKLRAAISAVNAHFPNQRLVLVFEPHTFSWRNKEMLHWFDTAFEGADEVLLYKPEEQGANTHTQISQEEMFDRMLEAGISVHKVSTPEEVMSNLKGLIKKGDIVLLSSSGAMDGLITLIPEWLDETFVD